MMIRFFLVLPFLICSSAILARELPVSVITVDMEEIGGLRDVIDVANLTPGLHQVNLVPSGSGSTVMRFPGMAPGSSGALPNLSGRVLIRGLCESRCTLTPADGVNMPLLDLTGNAFLQIERVEIVRFSRNGDGGAIYGQDQAQGVFTDCSFYDNSATGYGGAISFRDNAFLDVHHSHFRGNQADVFGNDLDINSSPLFGWAACLRDNVFDNMGGTVGIENPRGDLLLLNNTLRHAPDGIDSTANVFLQGNLFDLNAPSMQVQAGGRAHGKPEALCNDFGSGAFNSLGYNIAADNSCSLDDDTDLPGTDPMIAENDDGLLEPQPGSPAIDAGLSDVVVLEGETLAELPCGYKDAGGTARPQDANGDGVFECDRGGIEVAGAGEIVAGHSSVFYNPDRNGEGNYVEILDDGRAVVYTFTYTPDGTGPAWFIGVGEYAGNSIIMDEIFRPIGATFGDGFDADDIEFTPAGSMSMVFPDCVAAPPGGNVAYTGDEDLGFEGLITRATRLANIMGCGNLTPDPNAGLSGSFYDPNRNGEGVIVEWLSNGDVLVVFFTYDPDGNQFWLFGQAAANGKTVTMNAVYPSSFTSWGRGFNPDEVTLETWGTFTLTWTDCHTVTFEYDSSVAGFGSGTRNYTRLSTLTGTTCPAFP